MNIIYILLTFLAIGLTSIGVGLTVKYRSRTRLTYFHEMCLPLFVPGILGLRDIQVLYQKKPVDAPLYLFAGHFLNSGNTDIPKSSIHNPVLMQLPKTYEWSAPKILKSSARVRVKRTTRDKSILAFDWDLLKKNEFFKFAALVKAPLGGRTGKNSGTPENPAKVVFFSHRIANLGSIDRQESLVFTGGKWRFAGFLSSLGMLTMVAFFAVFFAVSPPRDISYLVENQNGERPTVSVEITRNEKLLIKGLDGELSIKVEPEELFTKYKFLNASVRVDWTDLCVYIGLMVVLVFIFGRDAIREYFKWRRQRMLRKMLKSE